MVEESGVTSSPTTTAPEGAVGKTEDGRTKWLPLESNPDVVNAFMHQIGLAPQWCCVDVVGLDEELLAWVPQPALAMLLLFPDNHLAKAAGQKRVEAAIQAGQQQPTAVAAGGDGPFFIRQRISNACGTIALVHALGNNMDRLTWRDGSVFRKFYDEVRSLAPEAISNALEEDPGMSAAHHASARAGDTARPELNDEVNHHFIAFVHRDGILYEMDGTKPFPIPRGPTTEATFLKDAAKVCQEFMDEQPGELGFTMMALAKSFD